MKIASCSFTDWPLLERIARYIREIVKNRHGNYLVFFPSYSFMRRIYELYIEKYAGPEEECIQQQESMSEEEREAFLMEDLKIDFTL